ncbi:MAG: hypothetical protein ABSF24_05600 [Candidatus Bathyarchaeia archaeon]|jgi:hypothetical protein
MLFLVVLCTILEVPDQEEPIIEYDLKQEIMDELRKEMKEG